MQVVLVTFIYLLWYRCNHTIHVITTHPLHPSWLVWYCNVIAVYKDKTKMRWMRHRTIILVSAIIYFKCIIATTIIAMVNYNYHTRFRSTTLILLPLPPLPPPPLLLPISQLATLLIIVHDLYSSSIPIQGAQYHRIKCKLNLLPPNP